MRCLSLDRQSDFLLTIARMTNLPRNASSISKALATTASLLGLGAIMLCSGAPATADPQRSRSKLNSGAEVGANSIPQEASLLEAGQEVTSEASSGLGSESEPAANVYNPAGKRDPFVPFDFSRPSAPPDPANPLTGFDYKELRLSSVLAGGEEPIAIVEDSTGRGFTVRQGTRIGKAGGEVIEIHRDKLVIQELRTDSRGGKYTERIELLLRGAKATEDESNPRHTR
jgi:Tfp pilus assembly protein PilP